MARAVAKKEPAKPRGRPKGSSLLHEGSQEELLNLIVLGLPVNKAVAMVNISESTFYGWMNRGMVERDRLATVNGAKRKPEEAIYLNFLESLTRARAEAIAKKVAVIAKSGNDGDWRAAAWWLERQVRDEFGKTDRVEIGGTNGEPIKIQIEMGELENKIAKVLAIRKK